MSSSGSKDDKLKLVLTAIDKHGKGVAEEVHHITTAEAIQFVKEMAEALSDRRVR